jgi:hypothetical protein
MDFHGPPIPEEVQLRFAGNVKLFLLFFRILLACLLFVRFHKIGKEFSARAAARGYFIGGGGAKGGGEAVQAPAEEPPADGAAKPKRKPRAKAA